MRGQPRQSTPVACTGLSWCSSARPLSEMSARPVLAGRVPRKVACAQGGVDALKSHLDLFVLPWLTTSGCQGVAVGDAHDKAEEGAASIATL